MRRLWETASSRLRVKMSINLSTLDRTSRKLRDIHSLGPATREWLVSSAQVSGLASNGITYAGFSEARRGYEFLRRSPSFSMILACEQGEGDVLIDGGWRRCTEGHAYVTSPRYFHAYRIRPGCIWRVSWVLYGEASNLPTLYPGEEPRLLPVDAKGLRLAIEGLCHETAGKPPAEQEEFWGTLVHQRVLRMLNPAKGDRRLERLWLTVRQELGSPWTLRRMAQCAGTSEETLRRLCNRHIHRSPMAHLTRLRMRFAADLLRCSTEKIGAIAARTGYADAFAFSTAFKRICGKAPSAFRPREHSARS